MAARVPAQAPGNVATNATADPVVNLSDAAAPAASVDIVVEGGDAQGHNDEEINAAAAWCRRRRSSHDEVATQLKV